MRAQICGLCRPTMAVIVSAVTKKRFCRRHPRIAAASNDNVLKKYLGHAAGAVAFFFLRQPIRPSAPMPVANSGSAAGSGVVDPIVGVFATPSLKKIAKSAELNPG